jgi:hypothetical protein
MTYLPIVLRVENFPQINFRKIAANRNKKFYLILNFFKSIGALFAKKPQKIEAGTKEENTYREYEEIA